MDPKFSGFISDVNMEKSAKFREVNLKVVFLEIGIFGILVCNLQTIQVMLKFYSDFVPPH